MRTTAAVVEEEGWSRRVLAGYRLNVLADSSRVVSQCPGPLLTYSNINSNLGIQRTLMRRWIQVQRYWEWIHTNSILDVPSPKFGSCNLSQLNFVSKSLPQGTSRSLAEGASSSLTQGNSSSQPINGGGSADNVSPTCMSGTPSPPMSASGSGPPSPPKLFRGKNDGDRVSKWGCRVNHLFLNQSLKFQLWITSGISRTSTRVSY